jgi:hypothetical protein
MLQRLAISGMTGHPSVTLDEKLTWVISNHLVENIGLKNETFALLAAVYGGSSEHVRAELLAQAETAMNPAGEDYERYEFFNLLSWLRTDNPRPAATFDISCFWALISSSVGHLPVAPR